MNVIKILESIPRIDGESASDFSNRVKSELNFAKINFEKEVYVPDRGDGRSGRIDIVAKENGKTYAIELDWITPRKKSIFKITNYPCDYGYVVLRDNYYIMVVKSSSV